MTWTAIFRNIFQSVFFCLFSINVWAQHIHFIYIQSSNKKPFYVAVNNKNFSSSPDGYIIIPKLTDGSYNLSIGFTQDQIPEQNFTIKVVNRDDGYSLKEFADKGWGLANLKTKEVYYSTAANVQASQGPALEATPQSEKLPAEKVEKATEQKAPVPNAFGEMLSQVVDDPDLMKETFVRKTAKSKKPAQSPPVKEPEIKNTVEETPAKTDETLTNTSVLNETPVAKPAEKENYDDSYNAAHTKGVIKVSEKSTDKGTDFVFLDFNAASQDTIRLSIPFDSDSIAPVNSGLATTVAKDTSVKDTVDAQKQALSAATTNTITEEKKTAGGYQPYDPHEKPFLQFPAADTSGNKAAAQKQVSNPFFSKEVAADADTLVNNQQNIQNVTTENQAPASSVKNVRTDCKKMVTNDELNKWKKKMINAGSDDEMIKVVTRLLGDKCITTDQVKSLGGLFLSDDGRFHFFADAYLQVYDPANYPILESQLLDTSYKARFKNILQ